MADLCAEIAARRSALSCRHRADHPQAHLALDRALASDEQAWLGLLCDSDGSFIFRYRDFSVALRYQEDTALPLWELCAVGAAGSVRQIAYDLHQSLVALLAHLDVVAARIATTCGTE